MIPVHKIVLGKTLNTNEEGVEKKKVGEMVLFAHLNGHSEWWIVEDPDLPPLELFIGWEFHPKFLCCPAGMISSHHSVMEAVGLGQDCFGCPCCSYDDGVGDVICQGVA